MQGEILQRINFYPMVIGAGLSEGATQFLYSITTLIVALTITDNPFIISLVIAARYIPFIAFSFVAGATVETGNIRRIIELSLISRFALVTVMAILLFSGYLSIPILVVLTFLISTARIFGDSAVSMSYIRHADKSRWTTIGAQIDLSGNFLEATMTAAAGTVFLAVGSVPSVTIVSILIAVTWLTMLPTIIQFKHEPKDMEKEEAQKHAFKEAWRAFADNHILIRICLSLTLQNSALISVQSMLLIYILSAGTSERWATLILGSFAVGLIAGSAISAKMLAKIGVGSLLLMSLSVATLSIGGIYIAVNYSSVIACAVTFLYGASVSLGNIAQRRYRQEIIPMPVMGRVSSLFGIAIMGSMPIATIVAGTIAHTFGYLALFIFASALSLVSLGIIFQDHQIINRIGTLA